MNGDRLFTISDITMLLKQVMHLPGNLIVCALGKSGSLGAFFEITEFSLNTWTTLAISAVVWCFAALFLAIALQDH